MFLEHEEKKVKSSLKSQSAGRIGENVDERTLSGRTFLEKIIFICNTN